MTDKQRRDGGRLLLALGSVLAVLAVVGAAEVAFRWAGWPEVPPHEEINEMDPVVFVQNRPGLSLRTFDRNVQVTINSRGFRSPVISLRKGPGVRRIAAMGDSTTFGWGVGDDETFCRRLEEALNGGGGPGRYEVMNAGVCGHSTVQGLRMFERRVLSYGPDVVLVSYALNDNDYAYEPYLYGEGTTLSSYIPGPAWRVKVHNWCMHNSRVCRWIIRRRMDARYHRWLVEHLNDLEREELRLVPREEYVANLERFITLSREHGFRLIFAPAPVQLKFSRYADCPRASFTDRKSCASVVAAVRAGLGDSPRPGKETSCAYFCLGRAYEYLGEASRARSAFRAAMRYEDAANNWRWRAREYLDLMAEVAVRHRVPVANTLAIFEEREFGDNPDGLFADPYHAGPLGHRIIAAELARLVRSGM